MRIEGRQQRRVSRALQVQLTTFVLGIGLLPCSQLWAQTPQQNGDTVRVFSQVGSVWLSRDASRLEFSVEGMVVLNLDGLLQGTETSLRYAEIDDPSQVNVNYRVYLSRTGEELRSGAFPLNRGAASIGLPRRKVEIGDTVEVRVSLSGVGYVDVTDQLNQVFKYPKAQRLGVARVWLVEERSRIDWMYLAYLGRWFRESLERGGWISYVLLLILLPWGLGLSVYHLSRLYLSPCWSIRFIRQRIREKDWVSRANDKCPVDEFLSGLASRAERIMSRRQGQRVHRTELRALDQVCKARIEGLADEIVGYRVRGEEKSGVLGRVLGALPVSLDSLWNAAVVAPLLGLLGTVLGISESFGRVHHVMVSEGSRKAMSALSSGINTALYTTVDGLAVGILLMVFYYICNRRAKSIVQALNEAGEIFWERNFRRLVREKVQVVE